MERHLRFLSSSAAPSLDLNESIVVTKSCAKRIKQLRTQASNDNLVLRLAVEGGGCSGFQYIFKMEDYKPQEKSQDPDDDPVEDKFFDRDGSKVVVDSTSFELIKGATIDFKEELIRSAFAVENNPQSESACGCGSSFAAKNFAANPALD